MYMPWELPDVLDGEIVRQGWQELDTLARLGRTTRGVNRAHLRITALETTWYMRNQLLRDTDWASMAHSLEIRLPLVDIDLFRATAPLLNSNSAPGKRAMARAPLKPLPEQVLRREKTGFTVPVRKWLTPNEQIFERNRGLREWAGTIYREYNAGGPRAYGDTSPIALIFRTGQLGDTLVALPAIESIRRNFPKHRLVLLTDRHPNSTGYVSSWDICEATGWFDRVIYYQPKERGWSALRVWLSLLVELRSIKVDQFFNLAPGRSKLQTMRDRLFFGIAAGMRGYHTPIARRNPGPNFDGCLPRLEPEWHRTIRSVSAEEPGDPAFSLPIPEPEREKARRVALAAAVDFSSRLLAVAPGSKMPAKKWPAQRFAELGRRIRNEFPDLQLVVLGGAEDAAIGHELCNAWGEKAYNLAGKLSIYGSAAVLEKCVGYVGNDTGTMHLAAMCSVPCVAIFSARDYPGRWDPYGEGHIVLRHEVECAGCFLEVCDQYDNKCLKLISVDEVHEATRKILAGS
jgi:ADP-heptose:LPS heptosyltransferase